MNIKRFIAIAVFAATAVLAGAGMYTAYAEEERTEYFFWSDALPIPAYATPNEDGTSGKIGIINEDGEKTELTLPDYEEAIKNRVLVLVNEKYLHTVAGSGADPFIEDGSTMIPLRAVADAFGFEIEWEQSEEKITLTRDSKTIILYIGKPEISVDGDTVYFENAVPLIKNDRTFLPVRKLAEILDIKVEWDEDTRTAAFSE